VFTRQIRRINADVGDGNFTFFISLPKKHCAHQGGAERRIVTKPKAWLFCFYGNLSHVYSLHHTRLGKEGASNAVQYKLLLA
jgi:hypothetical protein